MNKAVLYSIGLDIKRDFRDVKFISLQLIFPLALYALFNVIMPSTEMPGVNWDEYSLVSLLTFGIMSSSIVLLGAHVSQEKTSHWFDYLKVSPISESGYMFSHIVTYFVISIVISILMFLEAWLLKGVYIGLGKTIIVILVLNICNLLFLAYAVLIGQFGTITQPLGTLSYLLFSFLGGLFVPLIAMPNNIQNFVKWTPGYVCADPAWSIVEGKSISVQSIVMIVLYTIICIVAYLIIKKKRGE